MKRFVEGEDRPQSTLFPERLEDLHPEGLADTTCYAVQALELAAGAVNISLLGLNMRDGLK